MNPNYKLQTKVITFITHGRWGVGWVSESGVPSWGLGGLQQWPSGACCTILINLPRLAGVQVARSAPERAHRSGNGFCGRATHLCSPVTACLVACHLPGKVSKCFQATYFFDAWPMVLISLVGILFFVATNGPTRWPSVCLGETRIWDKTFVYEWVFIYNTTIPLVLTLKCSFGKRNLKAVNSNHNLSAVLVKPPTKWFHLERTGTFLILIK